MKRCLLTLALFVILGAIVNVAVAWVGASAEMHSHPRNSLVFEHSTGEMGDTGLWRLHVEAGWPDSPSFDHSRERVFASRRHLVGGSSGLLDVPDHATLDELRKQLRGLGEFRVERVAAGFPMRSLQQDWWSGEPLADDLFEPASGDDGLHLGSHVLPLKPIWTGFAINTVFYAVIVWGGWLLFAAPFVLRRTRRIRRGLCPKCAYDLRGIESKECPECGAAR